MKIIILGSGIIGVTSAFYLMREGHDVTIVDRQSQSMAECSFANGGQLSYSHIEPWASPASLKNMPNLLFSKNSPLVLRPRLDLKMYKWLLSFVKNCTQSKMQDTTKKLFELSLLSRKEIETIEDAAKIDHDTLKNGIMHVFDNENSIKNFEKQAQFQKQYGCDFELLSSRDACEKLEPALKTSPMQIKGGIYFPLDATGDANKFGTKLSEHLKENGVKFLYSTSVKKIITQGDKICHIETDKGELKADCYISALGAEGPLLLDKIGVKTGIHPVKGYSISIKITNPDSAPKISITDQKYKTVFTRLGDSLRVAGTAEFAGYNLDITESRINLLKDLTHSHFPDCGDIDNADSWACLRPSTPSALPIIGKTKYDNLFLNTGHGTLGWTLACGSAKRLSDIILKNKA